MSLMSNWTRCFLALVACIGLAACDALVHINATANVPADYTSVRVTIEEVWFNKSATAGLDDTTWQKFRFKNARSIELLGLNSGELTRIATDLDVPAGRYRQIRLFLADRHDDLHDAADEAGAEYNNEVRGHDEDGKAQVWPLQVLNPEQGIGMQIDLEVVEAVVTAGTGTSSAGTVQVVFDAARDLTEFRYGNETAFLLNASLTAFDEEDVGTIRGTFNLSQLSIGTRTGRPQVQVTAQKLDESLGRHVVVASAAVSRSGSFVLYPLPLDEDESTTRYDLVVHGPQIQTLVIRDVPVSEGDPGSASALQLGGLALTASNSYEVNVAVDAPVTPRGARIGFYQTLPGDDEPYLVELATVDPLSGRFARDVLLSRSTTIAYGTYGSSFTPVQGTPGEGASRYLVAAVSPHHGHGGFATTTVRPASPASDTAFFTVPSIEVQSPSTPGSLSTTVTVETPARYDRGVLMVTREGSLVTLASLDEVLQQSLGSTFVDLAQVPSGTTAALYHLEAWTWNSADAEDSFRRHAGDAVVDLSAAASATGTITIR